MNPTRAILISVDSKFQFATFANDEFPFKHEIQYNIAMYDSVQTINLFQSQFI